ncbi:hypothetical protein ECZU51_60860 [Escherichia coli]|nr:hypothetical protein ECZU51_60860 [Escherichia coli]
MSLTKSLLFTLLLSAAAVQASTRDEIERLWNPRVWLRSLHNRQQHVSRQQSRLPAGSASVMAGRLTRRLEGGAVYAGHCPYCHQFDPVLKQLAQQYGFSVFPTPDGQGIRPFLKHYRCHRR